MAALKVFGQPASTEVARVLSCLFEKNLEFELIRVDTFSRERKVPEFLQLKDPTGQVTFKDGDLTLVDSRKICRYLCETYADEGNKFLYGPGSLERASIVQWLQAEALHFEPPSSELVFHLAFAEPLGKTPSQAKIVENEEKLTSILDVYDERLKDSKYLAGDKFTLADLTHLPNSHYLATRSPRGNKLLTSKANVARWWQEISARPSWVQVVQLQS